MGKCEGADREEIAYCPVEDVVGTLWWARGMADGAGPRVGMNLAEHLPN
jgi:hypothetical protein